MAIQNSSLFTAGCVYPTPEHVFLLILVRHTKNGEMGGGEGEGGGGGKNVARNVSNLNSFKDGRVP
jgi:hypothetical protein